MALMALASNPLVATSVGTALLAWKRTTPPAEVPAQIAPLVASARHEIRLLGNPGKFVMTETIRSPLMRAMPAGPGGAVANAAQINPSGPRTISDTLTNSLTVLKRLPSNHVTPFVPI